MTEPQVWTLIGVFTTIMLGAMSFQTVTFTRTMRSEIGRLDAKIDGLGTALRTELQRVEQTLTMKIDHLDRDVSTLMRREWGDPTD